MVACSSAPTIIEFGSGSVQPGINHNHVRHFLVTSIDLGDAEDPEDDEVNVIGYLSRFDRWHLDEEEDTYGVYEFAEEPIVGSYYYMNQVGSFYRCPISEHIMFNHLEEEHIYLAVELEGRNNVNSITAYACENENSRWYKDGDEEIATIEKNEEDPPLLVIDGCYFYSDETESGNVEDIDDFDNYTNCYFYKETDNKWHRCYDCDYKIKISSDYVYEYYFYDKNNNPIDVRFGETTWGELCDDSYIKTGEDTYSFKATISKEEESNKVILTTSLGSGHPDDCYLKIKINMSETANVLASDTITLGSKYTLEQKPLE